MSQEDDDFYKPKPLKLNKVAEQETYSKIDEGPAEPVVQHFKPIVKESAYSRRNMMSLLIPIVVTAALGFGGYKGVVIFRDIAARADAADRDATNANSEIVRVKQETGSLEAQARDLEQSIPQRIESIRGEAKAKAEAKYREPIETTLQKLETAKQAHLEEAAKKLADTERIAADKVKRAHEAVERANKQVEASEKETAELKAYLRANKRTMRSDY